MLREARIEYKMRREAEVPMFYINYNKKLFYISIFMK